MYFWYIWQNYSTGITNKELTDVEIQEQTASLAKTFAHLRHNALAEKKGESYFFLKILRFIHFNHFFKYEKKIIVFRLRRI